MRLLLPLLFLSACFGGAEAPSGAGADSLSAEQQSRLLELKLLPTTRNALQQNALIDHAINQGYNVSADDAGFFYEVLDEGEYVNFQPEDIVTADYEVYYLDGTLVDKSKAGKPLRFTVGYLIEAWNLAIPYARPGGSIRVLTPSRLAYGEQGLVSPRGDTIIGANRPLEFVIKNLELLEE